MDDDRKNGGSEDFGEKREKLMVLKTLISNIYIEEYKPTKMGNKSQGKIFEGNDKAAWPSLNFERDGNNWEE